MDLNFNWHERAACYLLWPAVEFFPNGYDPAMELIDKYCNKCPVITDCAEDAVAQGLSNLPSGVWGGVYIRPLGSHHKGIKRGESFKLLRERAMLKYRDDAA